MDETFRSSVYGDEKWKLVCSVKDRTVIARFGTGTQGMFRLTHDLVSRAVLEFLPADEIVALGCLRGNQEWHITCKSLAAAEVLREAGELTVTCAGSRRRGHLNTLVPREVEVRILWCPAWVPQECVLEMLDSIARVQAFEFLREKVGENAVFSLKYRAILTGVWPARVPDRVTLEVFGEKVPLLLITKGKPRCCFLCGSASHTQAACPTPYCRYCNRSGHVVSNCPRKKQQQARREEAGQSTASGSTESPEVQQGAASGVETAGPNTESAVQTPVQTAGPSTESETPGTTQAMETAPPQPEATKRKHPGTTTEEPPVSSVRREEPTAPEVGATDPEVTVIPETQEAIATATAEDPVGSPDPFPDLEIDESPAV